jgi:hypothetical protein
MSPKARRRPTVPRPNTVIPLYSPSTADERSPIVVKVMSRSLPLTASAAKPPVSLKSSVR